MDTVGALVSSEGWAVSDFDELDELGSDHDQVDQIVNRQALIETEKNRAINEALDQRIDLLIGGIVEP